MHDGKGCGGPGECVEAGGIAENVGQAAGPTTELQKWQEELVGSRLQSWVCRIAGGGVAGEGQKVLGKGEG